MKLKSPLLKISLFLMTLAVSFVLTLTVRIALGFKSNRSPILVSLGSESADPITMKLQWGGYYATREENGYKIFRLLDINPNDYHIATYDKVFQDVPRITEVSYLIAKDEHVRLKAVDILTRKPIFFGRRELTRNDLAPYSSYLQKTGSTGAELNEQIDRLIKFSKEAPLETKLSDKGGLLNFDQASIY